MKNPKVKQEVRNEGSYSRAKRRSLKEILFGEWGDIKNSQRNWKKHRKTKFITRLS